VSIFLITFLSGWMLILKVKAQHNLGTPPPSIIFNSPLSS
jgi:hypothetical protein